MTEPRVILKLMLEFEEGYYYAMIPELSIVGAGKNPASAIRNMSKQWNDVLDGYFNEPDDKLSKGAIELKRLLHRIYDLKEHDIKITPSNDGENKPNGEKSDISGNSAVESGNSIEAVKTADKSDRKRGNNQ